MEEGRAKDWWWDTEYGPTGYRRHVGPLGRVGPTPKRAAQGDARAQFHLKVQNIASDIQSSANKETLKILKKR